MTIQIEINNPHYVRIVEDMASAVGLDVQTLCARMVEHEIDWYSVEITAYKRACVMQKLPGDFVKMLEEGSEQE